jgi:hypothetical protein
VPLFRYWEFVILARKLAIVSVSVGLRNSSSYQLAMMLLVLFAAFSVHVKNNPYFSHADRPNVLREHEEKVATDPLHASLETDIRILAKQNSRRGGHKPRRFFDVASVKQEPVDYAVLVALDYNTVEAVLLGSAILVCLSGLMFSSSRFTGLLAGYYTAEYDGLAWTTIILICFTLVCAGLPSCLAVCLTLGVFSVLAYAFHSFVRRSTTGSCSLRISCSYSSLISRSVSSSAASSSSEPARSSARARLASLLAAEAQSLSRRET